MLPYFLLLFIPFSSLSSLSFIIGNSLSSAFAIQIPEVMRFHTLRNVAVASTIPAVINCTTLYVSSYSGDATTFDLKQSTAGYSLTKLGVTNGSAPQASWLELFPNKKVVYGLDEAWSTPNGTITVYSNSKNSLEIKNTYSTLPGAVSTIVYNGGKGLAVAHYGAQALTTWSITSDYTLKNIGKFIFSTPPGPKPQQDKSHPHEALVDPTDSYILVPDLGSDLLRTFSINAADSTLRELTPFPVPPGSGPRHGAFYTPECRPTQLACKAANKDNTYFFLVSEVGNTVSSYKVTYGKDGLGFKLVDSHDIYGNITTPTGAAAAEGILSPDNKYFHTSGRNAPFQSVPNPDPANATAFASDSLQTWQIAPTTGKLTFQANYPAGGITPRQFSINAKGDLAAVGLQNSGRFVVIQRDVKTGAFGKIVASVEGLGGVTTVIWDEGSRVMPF